MGLWEFEVFEGFKIYSYWIIIEFSLELENIKNP